jgi:hypothetical protein
LSHGREKAKKAGGGLPLRFAWKNKCYLGAAHGVAGICRVLAKLGDAELDRAAADVELPADCGDARDLVRATLAAVAATYGHASGNVPPAAESKGRDALVQWCHGAPGFVGADLAVHASSRAADRGLATYYRGLLAAKGPGLSDGIAGTGAALLSLFTYTGDAAWLERARRFAVFLAPRVDKLEEHADQPSSLFQGSAGALAFFADVLKPENARLGAPDFDGAAVDPF